MFVSSFEESPLTSKTHQIIFVVVFILSTKGGGGHIGPKSLILAPQDIPDISGYQLGFGRQFVKAYNTENPVTNQKIL